MPPTTAHTGENSCAAVIDIVLEATYQLPDIRNTSIIYALDEVLWHGCDDLLVHVCVRKQTIGDRLQFTSVVDIIWQIPLVQRLVFPYGFGRPTT
jgi:hypothetical protein